MREIEKKAAKSIKDKIVNWMKGGADDMPIINSTPSQKPKQKAYPKEGDNWLNSYAKGQDVVPKVYKPEAKGNPSADMGRRLKQESDDFYNSDAGKNSPNKIPEGWGWDNTMGDLVRKKPPTKPSSSSGTMDGNQMGKFIKDYAADPANVTGKRDINNYVTKEDGFADFKKNINKNFVTKKNGMSATEKAAVGMGAGAVAGEAINDAMDLNQAMNRRDAEIKKNQSQQDAHGYWTRKKSGN